MASLIDKQELAHLAKLAKLELSEQEESKLLADLQKILEYVAELQDVDTKGVRPMNGGSNLVNSFRGDKERSGTDKGAGTDQFPEKQDGFLRVPAVFDR